MHNTQQNWALESRKVIKHSRRMKQRGSEGVLLTDVYRWPSAFIAMYKPVFTDWIATIRRPTGMRLNSAGEISNRIKWENTFVTYKALEGER